MSRDHWEEVYATRFPDKVSWYQERPNLSLRLIEKAAANVDSRVLDVGGGASRLVDSLLDEGFSHVGVLDIAQNALNVSKSRLGARASLVEWFVADVKDFRSPHPWDVWHDRAVFHFLVDVDDREAYRRVLLRYLVPGGSAVIATFGPEGPERCSGLEVARYTPETLLDSLGPDFEMIEQCEEAHRTPSGDTQQFIYCWFGRLQNGSGIQSRK